MPGRWQERAKPSLTPHSCDYPHVPHVSAVVVKDCHLEKFSAAHAATSLVAGAQVRLAEAMDGGSFELVTDRAHAVGEEITIDYGVRGSHQLLRQYGFVPSAGSAVGGAAGSPPLCTLAADEEVRLALLPTGAEQARTAVHSNSPCHGHLLATHLSSPAPPPPPLAPPGRNNGCLAVWTTAVVSHPPRVAWWPPRVPSRAPAPARAQQRGG